MIKKHIEKFTDSQEEALAKLKVFLSKPIDMNDINTRIFLLKGKAGTGKTTIIRYSLLKEIEEDFKEIDKNAFTEGMINMPNVMGVALSHKAKNVLSNSIHVCKTFASTFGLKQVYGEHGEINFEKLPKSCYQTYPCEYPLKAFIHDECSMYDSKMLYHVLNDTNFSSKIIFMGDPGQLPPINTEEVDADSPVFYLPLAESNVHELLERKRQTDENPILALSDVIYEQIFGDQDLDLVLKNFHNDNMVNGKGHRTITYGEFLNDFKNISQDYQDTKVVAYRNDRVTDFNLAIRNHVHNKPDKMFIPKEIIYMNDTYINKTKSKGFNGKPVSKVNYTCYNSDEYVIESVSEKDIEGIRCHLLVIDHKAHSHLIDEKIVTIPVVAKSSIAEFNRKCSNLSHFARTEADWKKRSAKWKAFYDFKENFGNVSYGYCYTGHKIQGSGYKNIYVDVNDIITVGPITTKRKLQALYTAITRAEEQVILLKR